LSARVAVLTCGLIVGAGAPGWAQAPAPTLAQAPPAAKAAVDQRQSRYQISMMERVLEGAVEHGASIIRDRFQAIVPATMLLAQNAQVRGFRLAGYGVFFDVQVPAMQGTLPWSIRTLDQNDLGLQSALKSLKSYVDAAGDQNLQQALQRVELQVGPLATTDATPTPVGARNATGSPAMAAAAAAQAPATQAPAAAPADHDPILDNPDEAYRTEIKQALMDAMLDYSGPLSIPDDEWLTIAARGGDEDAALAPPDTVEKQTVIIRIHGGDLAAFRAGRIARDEALKRMEVRVF